MGQADFVIKIRTDYIQFSVVIIPAMDDELVCPIDDEHKLWHIWGFFQALMELLGTCFVIKLLAGVFSI